MNGFKKSTVSGFVRYDVSYDASEVTLKISTRGSLDDDFEEDISKTLSIADFKKDYLSGSSLSDAHNCVVWYGDDTLDYFKHSKASKVSRISAVGTLLGDQNQGKRYIAFAIPYSDSAVSDWSVYTTGELYINDVEQTGSISNQDSMIDEIYTKLPTITATESSGTVTAQLVDPDGTNSTKSGVDIYFVSTVGSVSAERVSTDSSGQASVTVTGGSGGKVKVGFKHYPSKVEVNVA